MPPVMGGASFILASLTGVPYSQVIIAALIPAVAYFLCLCLAVMFQARRQNIRPIGKLTDDMAREIYGAEADEAFEGSITSTSLGGASAPTEPIRANAGFGAH